MLTEGYGTCSNGRTRDEQIAFFRTPDAEYAPGNKGQRRSGGH